MACRELSSLSEASPHLTLPWSPTGWRGPTPPTWPPPPGVRPPGVGSPPTPFNRWLRTERGDGAMTLILGPRCTVHTLAPPPAILVAGGHRGGRVGEGAPRVAVAYVAGHNNSQSATSPPRHATSPHTHLWRPRLHTASGPYVRVCLHLAIIKPKVKGGQFGGSKSLI